MCIYFSCKLNGLFYIRYLLTMEILRSDPKNDVYHQPHENAVWGGHFFDFPGIFATRLPMHVAMYCM